MKSTLLGLSIDMLDIIFAYLDPKAMLVLREVSKATKKLVESTVLSHTKSPLVDRLKVIEKNGRCKIDFTFVRNDLKSKLFYFSALDYLKTPVFFHLQGMNTSIDRWDSEFFEFFEQFAPLVKGTKFNTFEFYVPSQEVFSEIRKLLEGTTINELDFLLRDCIQPIPPVLALVRQVQTTAIRLTLGTYIEELNLYRLAKVVDSISISGSGIFTEIRGIMGIDALILTLRTLEFDLTKGEMLSGLLEITNDNKPFYFAARTNDGIGRETWAASARNHVIEVIEDNNGLSKNIIEVRHIAMTRRL